MKISYLIKINAIGCFLLSALVIFQWFSQRRDRAEWKQSQESYQIVQKDLTVEKEKNQRLEADVRQLKDSLESTQKEAEKAAQKWVSQHEQATQWESQKVEIQANLQKWQQAITERDAQIKQLSEQLSQARQRLDQAVAELKRKGAK